MSKVQDESSGHCQENESGSDRGPKQLHRGGIRFRYCSSKHVLTAGGPVSLGISTGSGFYAGRHSMTLMNQHGIIIRVY